MTRKFRYHTCCVNSTAAKIDAMTDIAREIKWRTILKHIGIDELREVFPSYSYRGEKRNPVTGELTCPFSLGTDWAVSFYKSKYCGRPCYYVVHSGIEYVFI